MSSFVDRPDFYLYKEPELNKKIKARLEKIQEAGMTLVGIAEFGFEGIMSGLYIEKVWRYSDEDFDSYMEWAINLKNEKEVKP